MQLIADSGSSKTDWRIVLPDGSIQQHRGVGFNPTYQSAEEMSKLLRDDFLLGISSDVQTIHYYGAGCSSEGMKLQVENSLRTVFAHAKIFIEHDLLAAARATCGREPGIACILGTGSNSCDYDGIEIIQGTPAPGYVLGDEGGGTYIGRKFLQDFIHEEMPSDIYKRAKEELNLDYNEIIDRVYKQPFAGRYMASFCKFISKYKSDPYCYLLFYNAFQEFFKKYVFKYSDWQSKQVNFVGSIAFYNSDILRNAAADAGIHVNLILESPIAGLTLYHKQ
jgi:N-acetylglucosamine kinase-like BadF-type ATPase